MRWRGGQKAAGQEVMKKETFLKSLLGSLNEWPPLNQTLLSSLGGGGCLFCFLAIRCGMCDLSFSPGIEPVPSVLEALSLNHLTVREVSVGWILRSVANRLKFRRFLRFNHDFLFHF